MFRRTVKSISFYLMSLMLLLLPAMVAAEGEQVNAGPPPIGQPLVREGDFAVKLTTALLLGSAETEIEAENQLSEAGISPKNGWIADYPVTPDIIDELYKAVREAATANKIPLSVDVALQKMNDVVSQAGLPIETQSGYSKNAAQTPAPQNSPNSTVINNYYQTEGPPTVTYYAPPPDYFYLYGWVPFPFWCAGFRFSGFFVLNDFHRPVFINNRVVFISNHFNDIRRHRISRIDPVTRFHRGTIDGTSLIRRRGDIPAIDQRRERAITNEPRMQTVPNNPSIRPLYRNGTGAIMRRNDAAVPAARNGATLGTPFRRDRAMANHSSGGGVVSTPNRGNRVSRNGGFDSLPSRENNIFGTSGRR